jgi:hypothetical protein
VMIVKGQENWQIAAETFEAWSGAGVVSAESS